MKFELAKEITFEEELYKELNLDLESLTGQDILDAEREFTLTGGIASVTETSKACLAIIAAKACNVPVELITTLPIRDFSRLTIEVQNFLLK